MSELHEHLAHLPPGPVAANNGLDRMLADCWNRFGGDDGGMAGYKLIGRMEQANWQPPVLSFVIERHGGTVCGSTRAELQHWSLDFDRMTATITKTGHRQFEPMAPQTSIKATAKEIAELILNGQQDARLQWREDGSVRMLVGVIYPHGSGFKRTGEGRRRSLRKQLETIRRDHGWQ
jgi:hypothetical protein